ncbi:glucuronate isomerase [Planctomyces sp. SH-PL62]|uniref:glucuronate isomerase n=1 Tax=Planctomyces sp. SH-PL62 TaxID=1636152 RepID=UPI00078D065A|nr:glucuronate isomerase [Planctomyces sp. SH-PL62]AMV38024.1 Uronate isomerase [Planctomyces sp. SH-PL62]
MTADSHSSRPADPAARELFEEMSRWPIFDPHSHINPHRPAARDLDEVLGYHYYTELAHSAGMPAEAVAPELPPRVRAENLARHLATLDNTVQYSWLIEIARTFHGFAPDRLGPETIGGLYDAALRDGEDGEAWDRRVWERSNLEAVFLTNEFDDPLEGWDVDRYVPCLRTDDLVLKLHEPTTVARLKKTTGIDVGDAAGLREAIVKLFERFVARGARACAISLPPDFAPRKAAFKRAVTPIRRALQGLELRPDEHEEVRATVFWTLAECCAEFRLPFDLMIGPIRNVYPAGVAGGRDLFDRRVSLHEYRELFNHFAGVTFPVSTLSPDAGAELVAYSWIFPNVLPMGHWWYSNVPTFIAADLKARLQAVPKVKLLGYYSDAYKLEFILPKFNMYRRILAETLAEEGIAGRGWSSERAIEVAKLVLVDNPRRVFAPRA